MEEKKIKEKTNYFTLIALLLVVGAMVTSFYKYYVNLDYDTLLTIECDPATTVCFYDEESYYEKLLIHTKTLDERCNDASNEQCLFDLRTEGLAETIDCNDENIEEWESCTNPAEFVEEAEVEGDLSSESE